MTERHYDNRTEADTKKALNARRAGTVGFNRCSETYKIPKPTLERHLEGEVIRGKSGNRLNGRLPTLPPEVSNEILAHISESET